ncbi:MAG: FtsH protease activity modulator HflK [Chloroflexota bacterium]
MYGQRRSEFDPDQLMRDAKVWWERNKGRFPGGGSVGVIAGVAVALLLAAWLATGIYTVGPDEQAALRLFGKFQGTEGPGLKWYFPSPVGTRNVEQVTLTKRMDLGFRDTSTNTRPREAVMITGDLNIIDAQMVVQYRILNLGDFLFNVDDPGDIDTREGRPDGRTLREASEAALRQVVGQRSIDDVLTVGKEQVQDDARDLLQRMLNEYGSGIEIQQVALQQVLPPAEVQASFDDVVAARSDKESRINQARAYEQDQLPRAKGAAQQVVQTAQGFKESRIALARGEAAEFDAILTQYQASPEVTRQRLYLEAMQEILPGVQLFVVDPDVGTLVPFTPSAGQGVN